MKTLFGLLATILFFTVPLEAFDNSRSSAQERWEGKGQVKDISGYAIGKFSVGVDINKLSSNKEERKIKIEWPGGGMEKTCTYEKNGRSWGTSCSDGTKGGGLCIANGMCQEYVKSEDGRAFATTIVFDYPGSMRLLTTELNSEGRAEKFFSQILHKVSE